MPWYFWALLACAAIAPFDAFYQHIRAQQRRDEIRRRQDRKAQADDESLPPTDHDRKERR